jgi:two-component system sensor histidine kinase DegS
MADAVPAETDGFGVEIVALENIFETMLFTIEKSRDDIYAIADEARQEFLRLSGELRELKHETLDIISQVETCELQEKASRVRLMEVSKNFDFFTEQDIKDAYDEARRLQVELSRLRENEKSLIKRRDDLERGLRRIEQIAQRAETLVERVNVVVKMLKGNVEFITTKLSDVNRKQQLGIWLIQAQEEERRKLARELHDGPAQGLANLVIRLEIIEKLWDQDQKRVKGEIAALKELARENIGEVRRVIFDLRPMALDDLGLVPALKRYLEDYQGKFGIKVDFRLFGEEKRLVIPLEVALFRLIQEALSNIHKHAQVDEATVKMEFDRKFVTTVIKDEGIGFEVDAIDQGKFGLMGMRERVELFGGSFTVKSRPQKGTKVILRVPLGKGETH